MAMDYDKTAKQKERALARAMSILEEHFDCGVLLACHRLEESESDVGRVFDGFGNCFTQLGMLSSYHQQLQNYVVEGEYGE